MRSYALNLARPWLSSSCSLPVPVFLAPALANVSSGPKQKSSFSTTCAFRQRRHRRRDNPERGVSALRRTGPKKPLSVSSHVREHGLPKPVVDLRMRSKVEVDPKHGLYEFFNDKNELLTLPDQEKAHGRAWTREELRYKSWEDLHALWWMCCKERNRIATEKLERQRMKLEKGEKEGRLRDLTLRKTQKAIKWALTERWYAWEDAWQLAQKDPEVDLEAGDLETPIYTPREGRAFVG